MKRITLYAGGIGINNKVAPYRLALNENGVNAFEQAVDMLVSRTGEIVTRKGTTEEFAGEFHSLYSTEKDWGLVVKNNTIDASLYQVIVSDNGSVDLVGIWSGLAYNARLDYCNAAGDIFYVNGTQRGKINKNGVRENWTSSQWPNDRSNVGFTDLPQNIDHIAFNSGRIYFSWSDGGRNLLGYTEYGMLGIYDPATNAEQFSSKVIAIVPTSDGLYVSDSENIYFLAGLDPHKWTMRKATDYPALEWGESSKQVDPSFLGYDTNVPSSLLATSNGPIICMPSGVVSNLIDKQVTMSDCQLKGSLAVFDETLVIQSQT